MGTAKAKKAAAGAADAMRQAELKAKKDAEKAKAEQERLKKENEDNKNNKAKNKSEDELDLNNSAFSPEAMAMINGLKTELNKMEKMYEKKIEIINNQMHNLKDENFIRQQLQRDSLLLHKIDVRYQTITGENPRSVLGSASNSVGHNNGLAPNPMMIHELKAILPDISENNKNNVQNSRPKTTPGKKISDFQLNEMAMRKNEPEEDENNINENSVAEEFAVFEAS